MVLNTPPQVAQAEGVVEKLETLRVGQSVVFDPPLSSLTTHVLYLLLKEIDKGWRITPWVDPALGWWKRLKENWNQPVTFGGRPIPQTISEIQRTR